MELLRAPDRTSGAFTPRLDMDGACVSEPALALLIASRSPAFAEGLRNFLRGTPAQVTVCHTVHQALAAMERNLPSLLMLDWHLGDGPGLELMAEARRRGLVTPTVCFVEPGPGRPRDEAAATAAGASACVITSATQEAILEAVSDALDRKLDPVAANAIGDLVQRTGPRRVLLTPQERVVLRLMRQQLTYKEIAIELSVSWHTVRSHAQAVLRKLGIHSRRDLDSWDARLGAPAPRPDEVAVA